VTAFVGRLLTVSVACRRPHSPTIRPFRRERVVGTACSTVGAILAMSDASGRSLDRHGSVAFGRAVHDRQREEQRS
jgi:hypothetical protein